MIHEKRPRHYAAEIMALQTRQERRDALDKVPEKYKDWVADLVKSAYSLRRKTP